MRRRMRLRPAHRNRSVSRRLPSVAQCLGDVDAPDLLGACEVGDRPGYAKHPMESSGGEAHCGGGVGEELAAGLVGRRDPVQQLAVGLCVRARAVAVIALRLDFARSGDPARDFRAALGGRRQSEVGGGNAGHFDVEVDPIEQGA